MDMKKLKENFKFRGQELNYIELKERMEIIKVYSESSHKDRLLMKDTITGDLYLYDYDEYVTFDSRGDITNELYVHVKSEPDADELNLQSIIQRSPYIHVMSDFTIKVYE